MTHFKIYFLLVISILMYFNSFQKVYAANTIWNMQSIDTMKYSRDNSKNPKISTIIPVHVKAVAVMGANYIAIATPYDDEFIPILTKWVEEARKYNLKVWFRGNFSGWEGWFDYPKLSSINEHHTKTYRFITQNPTLFKDGDIFTPAPEAENGIIGDPRRTRKFSEFNKFLVDSYENCSNAFSQIDIKVNCGIYSLNTDVVRETVTKETIKKLGGVVAVDHYTNTPEKLIQDVINLHKQFDAKVFLGEFGAPIPDINGYMTQKQQAEHIGKILGYLYENRNIVYGMNYWVISGGSTSLLNDDNSERLVVKTMQQYFSPGVVTGVVKNTQGEALSGILLETSDPSLSVKTNKQGKYTISSPLEKLDVDIDNENYKRVFTSVKLNSKKIVTHNFILDPQKRTFLYNVRLFLRHLQRNKYLN